MFQMALPAAKTASAALPDTTVVGECEDQQCSGLACQYPAQRGKVAQPVPTRRAVRPPAMERTDATTATRPVVGDRHLEHIEDK
ncbi:hypothetical protein ACTMTJ_17410 [Phytohabitans sp. LJ34]|uniref:hypothetical protein n=1 Tax=Phytohabitans sp. LJ34 TaxID=3452217 RepID=UPI003F8CCAA3